MLRLSRLPIAVVVATPLIIALPVSPVVPGPTAPVPIPAEIAHVAVAADDLADGEAVVSQPRRDDFALVAASWLRDSAVSIRISVRTLSDETWSAWDTLSPADVAPDLESADAVALRATSEPLWAGESDGVEARFELLAGMPRDVRLDLIDPGTSPADATVGVSAVPLSSASAEASTDGRPAIITRAAWGADENLRLSRCPDGPSYTQPVHAAFVHHTASGNNYTPESAPAAVRALYAWAVSSGGYCDIPYNFLVDRFGRIYEGRFGGIDNAVLGGHTGGFNSRTFAVSALGTFSTEPVPSEMVQAIGVTVGWKLGRYGRDPSGLVTLVAGAGAGTTSRYPEGAQVTVNVVSGHRDVGATECPGNALYAYLPTIRQIASAQAAVTPLKPPADSTVNFVEALYADFLGRGADPQGLDGWSGAVYRGLITRQQAAYGIAAAPERTRWIVADLYRRLLGRQPDPVGLEGWAAAITHQAGALNAVVIGIFASDEYLQNRGGNLQRWAGDVYGALLGRSPDAVGLGGWTAVAQSSGRTVVVDGIYRSPESLGLRINAVYRQILGRGADPTGVAGWAPLTAQHGDIVVATAVAASEEYFARAQERFG